MSAKPSLTPNEDAVRAVIAAAPDRASVAAPGPFGVYCRLLIAMREARAIAVAQELDRASPPAEIIAAFASATAAEIFIVAAGLAGGRHAELAAEVSLAVDRTARAFAEGQVKASIYPAVPVASS